MEQVWQTTDNKVFDTESEAIEHEDYLKTKKLIHQWIDSRTWTNRPNATWLETVLNNDYHDLRDFLNDLP